MDQELLYGLDVGDPEMVIDQLHDRCERRKELLPRCQGNQLPNYRPEDAFVIPPQYVLYSNRDISLTNQFIFPITQRKRRKTGSPKPAFPFPRSPVFSLSLFLSIWPSVKTRRRRTVKSKEKPKSQNKKSETGWGIPGVRKDDPQAMRTDWDEETCSATTCEKTSDRRR